ncbi:MAG: PDZ domain-containing protein [Alphaproteobacteria bacterium]|jgi:predicted metalloprotease with PDZ domain|nr:PDZ domain-containing protein [Alphaproteobacteria bacterium]
MNRPAVIVPALALWLLAATAVLAGPPPAADDGAAPDAAPIERLIDELGADAYDRRARAQRALESLPAAALPRVARHYRRVDDPEVRMRLQLYAKHHYKQHVRPKVERLQRPAFLGVAQALTVGPDRKPVIEVRRVLDGTAADAAGFESGDQIVAIGGQRIDRPDVDAFSRAIKNHSPGTSITFTVRRARRMIELPATLGPMPDEHMSTHVYEHLHEQIRRHRRRWWNERFTDDAEPADRPTD